MPAAAVTPAPTAYIKVVAVKKLVVGFLAGCVVASGRVRAFRGCAVVIFSIRAWPSFVGFASSLD